jgi:hypothetical protein
LAFQKGLRQTHGETPERVRGQNAEESASRRNPRQRPLQHTDEQAALVQLAHDQGGEGPIGGEVGAQQNAAEPATGVEELTTGSRRNMEHRDRFADQWQGGSNAAVAVPISVDPQVTGLAPRRCRQRGKVHRKALLQFTCTARRDQRRTRRAAADVDQETRSIGLRTSTGKRSGGRPRAARRPRRGDHDDAAAHRSLGLA